MCAPIVSPSVPAYEALLSNHTYRVVSALQIVVNGKELPRTTELWYFAANKPKGYLCANAPGKDGTTKLVIDLFEVTP